MENKKPRIPAYDREPSKKSFTIAIVVTLVFLAVYGFFLVWRNYYAEDATPPIDRKQLSVPSYMVDSAETDSVR